MLSRLWRAYAHLYDGLLEVHTYRDMLALVGAAADCRGRTVLDVGAGTGNVTRALLDAGAAHVVAVDFSAGMLRHAHRKLATEVAEGSVRIVAGDAVQAMAAMPEASVDRITAVNVIYALQHRAAFFEEAERVLTPDGFLIAAHTTRPGMGPIVRDQFRRAGLTGCLRPRLLGIAAIDLVIDLVARGGRYHFVPISTLAGEAGRAGLACTTSLGRCYGGDDGVNELVRISTPATLTTDAIRAGAASPVP